ncbi:DUF2130 domain-containing protein [Candidatus Woesebacteria bacterium]|nr:DUF2130 domain-containing protein [Candidatus Woesebacteria bacterium]
MNDILCPNCKKVFKVDEAGFADILKQVRDHVFNKELHERLELAEKEKESAVKLAESNVKNTLQNELAKKEVELADLKSKINSKDLEKKIALTEAVSVIEKQRDELQSTLQIKEVEARLREASMKEKYDGDMKLKDETIERLKDMKSKMSTKMIGETLEQHCEIEFNKLRSIGFQGAYFEKDNDSRTGSKGDYIYRETDDVGNEIISIMFEMKNEGDETATKHKNDDFLRELDKDRSEKECEYAVLVTLLEPENELYNAGIVDVSHKYPKMYVVRPQFFIPIITVLRNAALNSIQYKSELALIRSQNIDITSFEEDLLLFQDGFMKNVKESSGKFQEAMDGIDATIKKLEGIKEALRLSNKHLLTAGSKVETVSVKRLTKNNPTMAAKFAELSDSDKT